MARMPTLHVVILAEHRGRWIAADGLFADRIEQLLSSPTTSTTSPTGSTRRGGAS